MPERSDSRFKRNVAAFKDFWRSTEDQVANEYLANFGLTWQELRDREILDIGAGMGGFAKAAQKRGIRVVSLDRSYGEMGITALQPFKDIPFVEGDALHLEDYFKEPQFDLVVSRRAVKYMVTSLRHQVKLENDGDVVRISHVRVDPGGTTHDTARDRFDQLFTGVRSVLKPHGEFRFDAQGWVEELFGLDEDNIDKSRAFLQKIDPRVEVGWGSISEQSVPYFVLKNV